MHNERFKKTTGGLLSFHEKQWRIESYNGKEPTKESSSNGDCYGKNTIDLNDKKNKQQSKRLYFSIFFDVISKNKQTKKPTKQTQKKEISDVFSEVAADCESCGALHSL